MRSLIFIVVINFINFSLSRKSTDNENDLVQAPMAQSEVFGKWKVSKHERVHEI